MDQIFSDIGKFFYLKAFLCDSGNVTISGLSLWSANCVQDIELLKDRNGDRQVPISTFCQKSKMRLILENF